jgi:hypothetical protein
VKRKYRMQPSEKAGYLPGKFVVQYYEAGYKVWFDASDPLTKEDAQARIKEQEQVIDNPTPAGDVKVGDRLSTTKGTRPVVAVEPTSWPNGQDAVRIVYEIDGGERNNLTLWPGSGLTVVEE